MPSQSSKQRKMFMSKFYGKYWITARDKYDINRYHINYIELICNSISIGSSIFDVGIGTGIPFADRLQKKGYVVHGIDISEDLILECKRNNKFISCLQGDAGDIKFEDNYFDCTYCFASTWYFPELYKSIDEMIRVTKKSGILYFDIQNINNETVRENYEKRIAQKSGLNLVINYVKNLIKIITRRGFVDWTNIIYDVPTNLEELLNHLKSNDIQDIKIFDANNDLKEISITDNAKINSGCLLFVIKV